MWQRTGVARPPHAQERGKKGGDGRPYHERRGMLGLAGELSDSESSDDSESTSKLEEDGHGTLD